MRRGVHLQPFGYHNYWLPRADYWTSLMQSMGIEVVLMYSAGFVEAALRVLLDAGIQPVLRLPSNLPNPYPHMIAVEKFVKLLGEYNVEPIIQLANEPKDSREWVGGEVPDDWWEQFIEWWVGGAQIVIERGGVAGFPDGPCFEDNPFPLTPAEWWLKGKAIFLAHNYGLSRPPSYPRDDVSRLGVPLTEAEHREALGVFYNLPGWHDDLAAINAQRTAWANPDASPLTDDTCWRGWEKVAYWMQQTLGQTCRMALTEGGWTPGAQAGSHPRIDIRYPKAIPETVAKWTLEALAAPDCPFEFQTFWLLADSLMGGAGGWDGDAWVTGTYLGQGYEVELPVVRALQGETPPPLNELRETIGRARATIETAADRLRNL